MTWYHNVALLEKVRGREHRLWYARQAIEHGWSRNVLLAQIETGLHEVSLDNANIQVIARAAVCTAQRAEEKTRGKEP